MSAVPKDRKGPRLICAEPMANQWMQQAIRRWLEGRVKRTTLGRSINFRSQEESRHAALLGSASASIATLDLSEASDRLSYSLVKLVFEGHSTLWDAFDAVRTKVVEQEISYQSPRQIRLSKFSTMGSALTFPVQSIVFTLLCVWALRLTEGREHDWRNWRADFDRVRVFGDDLIVPTHAYEVTCQVLHLAGLRVNIRKSFNGKNFRESCGCDAFKGVDVTPPRLRKAYDGTGASTASLVEFSNNLFLKGFWRAADKMTALLPPALLKKLWVSRADEPVLGLVSFSRCPEPTDLKWDQDYQRWYAVRVAFSSKVKRTSTDGTPRLLQYFIEDPASQRDSAGLVWFDRIDEVYWEPGQPMVDRLRICRSRVYL